MISKKALAIELSKVKFSVDKKIHLEQYDTESELAATILWKAYMNGSIEGKKVVDLGCGSGIFGIGALLLGASKVYFLDIDKDALDLAKDNVGDFDAEFILGDVSEFDVDADTVLMNPPFGVQLRKADKVFLEKAFEVGSEIYSLHKIESEGFISKISSENGFEVVSVDKLLFLLKKSYDFHKKDKHFVDVGFWHLRKV